jgi:hypothetical protein
MTGSNGKDILPISGCHRHGCKGQGLPSGRTGAIKAKQGNIQLQQAKRCGNILPQQIPPKNIADILLLKPCLAHRKHNRLLLQRTLRLFPGILPKFVIFPHHVK